MLKKIDSFDSAVLKRGKGIVVTEGTRNPVIYHGLVVEILPLRITVAFVKNGGVEVKDIRAKDVAEGKIKIVLAVPIPMRGAVEIAHTQSNPHESSSNEPG
jgi:hypothetical protein